MKTSTIHSILVVLFTFVLAYPSPSTACECIVSGETKSDIIGFPGETHCYYFWVEASRGIVAKMAPNSISGAFTPRLELYDPDGIRVVDCPGGYVASIRDYQSQKTGYYSIVASSVGLGTGECSVSLVLASGPTTSPQDRDGGNIISGETRCGSISVTSDTDAYAIYGHAGQGFAGKMAPNSTSGGFTPRLELYDPDGIRVVDCPGGYVANIGNYQLEKTGIYTVVASSVGMGTGEYSLSISVVPPKSPYGLYPYDPQPADGQLIDYCDPNYQIADVVVENRILSDGSVVKRWSGGNLLSCWSVIGATGYDFYFSASPCMPLEKIAENITDPYLPMPEVEDGQICSWRVVAHISSEDIQGPTWWFVTQCRPPCGLTISAIGQGSIVEPKEGFHEYSCGDVVSVTAVAKPNYEFVRWEGSAVDDNKTEIEYQNPTGSKIWVTVDSAYTLTAIFEEIIHDFPLNDDPGWIMEGQWQFGVPTGLGGEEYGNPDPIGGYTGPNVLGVNLNGDYDVEVGPPYSLVAGPFDLSDYNDVNLRFARWLNIDEPRYVTASVDMSIDGENWVAIWESETEILDSQWIRMKYVLGDEAAGKPAVSLRWTYQVVGERAYPCSGWNLDDIHLCGKRH